MSDITYKIRWLLKTANPEPLTLVLEEEEIAELASQWDTTVKGDGSMAFEGVRIVSKTNYNLNNLGGDVKNKSVQKLTPGQALDWAKGISHQSLNVDYLIGTDGEQYYPGDILEGAVLQDNIAFIADPQRLEIGAYEIMQLMAMAFRWGEDGVGTKQFKQKMVVEIASLGFENIEIDKDSVL